MKKKEFWHIYPGTVGAAGAYADALQKALREAGIKAFFFVSWAFKYNTENTIKCFYPITDKIPNRGFFLKIVRGIEVVFGMLAVWFLAIFRRPIIVLHTAGPFFSVFIMFFLCKIFCLKVGLTCHDVATRNKEMGKLRLLMLERANFLIVHSFSAKKLLIGFLNDNVKNRIKYHPFPFSSYDEIIEPAKLREAEDVLRNIIPCDKDYFLFTGPRMCKGIETLKNAWEINSRNFKSVLLIAGKWGDVPRNLINEIKKLNNCVILDRYLTNEEFYLFIKKAKFIVLPYLEYSHSSVLISCAHLKAPVITSNIALFEQYLPGYPMSFQKGDSNALSKILKKSEILNENEIDILINKLNKSVKKENSLLIKEVGEVYHSL
ncbi:hypothetical protein [Sedimentisphaera salicampi]|uniref:Uncharacterized protein n=1 Tax=Sedimentisphaera salicampi TaxID=1941349 RepID=A0A1W6LKI6_9BACT|nr:hypothetical protein [Sedimentisphaera salicampi]ARN56287.1 hypothetical protein STSP1_00663 [Sedimentisphaera salicampi]